ncbi:hypothetical protein [Bacillus thuringiensis]|uniref:hypothetical protein n=1 Tax=Bacillus thuringiensis TaxID=1428 RepID=UPI00148273EC|nr:hypothetical protein [Bacillus thuringiensis]
MSAVYTIQQHYSVITQKLEQKEVIGRRMEEQIQLHHEYVEKIEVRNKKEETPMKKNN